MTKDELFKKYHIAEGHKTWEPAIDNWVSVEIYRVMHDGELPPPDDTNVKYVLDYLDKSSDPAFFFSHPNAGSLYTTAHRMVYRYADQLVKELSKWENK